MAYFIEFHALTGLWGRWPEGCPLNYASTNAPSRAEVLGTWMLSILAGHRCYSHVTVNRCDGVNPGLLGMNKAISEDAMRGALNWKNLGSSFRAAGIHFSRKHADEEVGEL